MMNINFRLKNCLKTQTIKSFQNFYKFNFNNISEAELINFSNKSFKSSTPSNLILLIIKFKLIEVKEDYGKVKAIHMVIVKPFL